MAQDPRHEATIRREEARLERAKAKAEAYEKNMTKTLAELLKRDNVKRNLAKDAMAATRDDTGRMQDIYKRAGSGTYDNDREVITGNEPRPWEE